MKSKPLAVLLTLSIWIVAATGAVAARDEGHETESVSTQDVIWTSWDARHYALIDDGNFLWIGTASGLVRYDKQSGSHLRLSNADGLPHHHFYCGAVDESGNRWFGGDGGLSKLDAAGQWTHYNSSTSGLYDDDVNGIAITTSGDVWLSHSQQTEISRLRPDGSWTTYPNRETAVSLTYNLIKETMNTNDLWTVAGSEVWTGYNVFDGAAWIDRTPMDASPSPLLIADSRDHVWAVAAFSYMEAVVEWDGQNWSTYEFQCESCIDGRLTNLAVDSGDVIWVGGVQTYPYSGGYAAVGRLPAEPGPFTLDVSLWDVPSPIADLLATAEGLWISGPNWLIQPDGRVRRFQEVPFPGNARRVIVDGHQTTWLHNGWYDGVLQTLDDKGTGTLSDDSGEIVFEPLAEAVMEIAANGDLWFAWVQDHIRYQLAYGPRRYYQNKPLDFIPPVENAYIRDIFAEDARHTWFVYDPYGFEGDPAGSGIWRLDDGGTPADFSDDVWTNYETEWNGEDGIVAVRDGKLWYGNHSGVYRYHENGWEQLTAEPAEELIPAQDGILLVNVRGNVLVIEADGRQTWRYAKHLVLNNYSLVRSTSRRTQLWRVTPDGAIWYWHGYPQLGRWDGQNLQTYIAPVEEGFIEVDQNNHVWLVAEGDPWIHSAFWRMSPRPDFQLSGGPSTWFITPDGSREFALTLLPFEGYANTVRLSVGGLPAGVTADLNPPQVAPGESAVVTLTSSAASLGETVIKISGVSGDTTHAQDVTLAVVEQVHEMWLPVVPQKQ